MISCQRVSFTSPLTRTDREINNFSRTNFYCLSCSSLLPSAQAVPSFPPDTHTHQQKRQARKWDSATFCLLFFLLQKQTSSSRQRPKTAATMLPSIKGRQTQERTNTFVCGYVCTCLADSVNWVGPFLLAGCVCVCAAS